MYVYTEALILPLSLCARLSITAPLVVVQQWGVRRTCPARARACGGGCSCVLVEPAGYRRDEPNNRRAPVAAGGEPAPGASG